MAKKIPDAPAQAPTAYTRAQPSLSSPPPAALDAGLRRSTYVLAGSTADRLVGVVAEADRAALEQTRALSARLREQAGFLRAYWQDGTKEQADRYHKAREQVWEELRTLLGIE